MSWWMTSFSSIQFSCSVVCLTIWDPMNCSTPSLSIHHKLPESTQTHAHRVSDGIQPSHPLSAPLPPAPNPSQHQGLFQRVSSSHEVAGVSALASVLPVNTQDWSPLGWTDWISWQSKGLSRVFSNTIVQKASIFQCSAFFTVQLSHPYMTTGKNHSLDQMDLCWQSNVSAF